MLLETGSKTDINNFFESHITRSSVDFFKYMVNSGATRDDTHESTAHCIITYFPDHSLEKFVFMVEEIGININDIRYYTNAMHYQQVSILEYLLNLNINVDHQVLCKNLYREQTYGSNDEPDIYTAQILLKYGVNETLVINALMKLHLKENREFFDFLCKLDINFDDIIRDALKN